MSDHLPGGADNGAVLVDGTVRRAAGPWSPAVRELLTHLAHREFAGAPRALGTDAQGREMVSYLPGDTVGDRRPWPECTHDIATLREVAIWLRDYHRAVADFEPASDAVWREGVPWQPGLIIAHNDAAAYNAVWNSALVGFVDWDMAGPSRQDEDHAWVAFSWTPLHARHLVSQEGFTDFDDRRARLTTFLDAYGWTGTVTDILNLMTVRVHRQSDTLRRRAASGDPTYRRMIDRSVDAALQDALFEISTLL